MNRSLFRPKMLDRERINHLLEGIFETPIFYISASMGYGKTTAVRCFLENKKEINSVWIPMPHDVGDEKWVWHKCCHYIESYNIELARKLFNIGLPENELEVRKVVDIIIEAINKPTVVVIDDYQDIKGNIFIKMLTYFAESAPEKIHIVIISRIRPQPDFFMFNLKNQCNLMWQTDLAFTKEETRAFFVLNGFVLENTKLNEMYEYTMGWIASIYLLLLNYATNQNIDAIIQSAELIKTVVYDTLDSQVQQVLMMLAPLESFSLEQAVYITQIGSAGDSIKEMVKRNCFINLDVKTQEYHFHTIFKHTLLEELESSKNNQIEVLTRCAMWYEAKNNIILAIEYYDKAKNHKAILKLMSKMGAMEYMDIAPKLIIDVFSHMSLEEKLCEPIGYLTYIHAYLRQGGTKEAVRMLYEAKDYYEVHVESENRNQILGEILLIEGLTKCKDYHEIVACQKKAYAYFDKGHSIIAGKTMIFTFGSIYLLVPFWHEIGTLKANMELIKENIWYFNHMCHGCGMGGDYLVQAEYAYETGALDEAKVLAYKTIYKAETKDQMSIMIDAYFILMRVALAKGEKEAVGSYIKELEIKTNDKSHPMLIRAMTKSKAYIYALTKELDKIPEDFRNFKMSEVNVLMLYTAIEPIIYGMTLLLRENYIQLEILMETILEEYNQIQYLYGMIHAYILMAIARNRLYGVEKGVEVLGKAIELAKQDGIIMPFIERKEELNPLFEDVQNREPFIKMMMTYINKRQKKVVKKEGQEQYMSQLTEREIEVIKLFIRGYKQSEIATELHISIDTVKRHIKNIYSKLDIHSKAKLIEKMESSMKQSICIQKITP